MPFKYTPHGPRHFSKAHRFFRWVMSLFVAVVFLGGLGYVLKKKR